MISFKAEHEFFDGGERGESVRFANPARISRPTFKELLNRRTK
jgi:hypothetical protein